MVISIKLQEFFPESEENIMEEIFESENCGVFKGDLLRQMREQIDSDFKAISEKPEKFTGLNRKNKVIH
ncbi:MAG: hypothetical protein D6B27_05840 [Gammaproteobacteria bacterium]|nr:MAG: hypothetical protein D6B27_05840 [Gammaproteobacteria bacterium]